MEITEGDVKGAFERVNKRHFDYSLFTRDNVAAQELAVKSERHKMAKRLPYDEIRFDQCCNFGDTGVSKGLLTEDGLVWSVCLERIKQIVDQNPTVKLVNLVWYFMISGCYAAQTQPSKFQSIEHFMGALQANPKAYEEGEAA